MATKKITQSSIKRLVAEGAATDIDKMKVKPERRYLKRLGLSFGTFGMNGALYLHTKNGKMYAITSRNSTLFEYE